MSKKFKNFAIESNVRSYCRSYPVKFIAAHNEKLFDEDKNEYLDFFSGSGALNYGHNNPLIKNAVIDYIARDGVIHSLDMMTDAKESFIKAFSENILQQRNMDYKIQFCGPTGTNAVEAAIKLAKKVTGRNTIFAFTRGFHGMTAGSLAATSNEYYKSDAADNHGTYHMPFEGYFGDDIDTIKIIEKYLSDSSSGYDKPAAMIVETIQGEGGLNVASKSWLQRLEKLCKMHEVFLIIDDIQAGCGRSGKFFSFEDAEIKPDIVLISKSISGYGFPMAIVLIKPELDQWKPAEHNGTFRGNNIAFISSCKMIELYWKDRSFEKEIEKKSKIVQKYLEEICKNHAKKFKLKGKGMMMGVESVDKDFPSLVKAECFNRKMIIDNSGPSDEVIKIFCPLTISEANLIRGMEILTNVINFLIKQGEENDCKK